MKSICALVVAILLLAGGVAFADPVDFGKLSVNGVAPGDTVAQVKGVLGEPSQVKGSKGQFLLYPAGAWGRLTLELTADGQRVAFVDNGSTLALDGRDLLKLGDPASQRETALPGLSSQAREKVDSWDYYYEQGDRMLIVVVKDGKIADLMLGAKAARR